MLDNNDNQEIEDEISPPPLSQFDKELVNDNLFLNSNQIFDLSFKVIPVLYNVR